MEASAKGSDARAPGQRAPERRGAQRPPEEARRKRAAAEKRYAGWGDGIERAFCGYCEHLLPADFPVHSRHGVATIVPRVVARRPEALLLCTFDHAGPHIWPDGELTEDATGQR